MSLQNEEAAPEHHILERAMEYEIVGVCLDRDPEDGGEPRLDLKLKRGTMRVTLRFWAPKDIELERGGPVHGVGAMFIDDVSGWGRDNINVQVGSRELHHGVLSFYARDVERLDSKV